MTYTPEKFLCRYRLSTGAVIYALIFLAVSTICIIVIAVEMSDFSRCGSADRTSSLPVCIQHAETPACMNNLLRNAYGFSGAAIIYCVILLFIHLWFIWAIKREKSSVVLMWVVVTSMWLFQSFCLFVVCLGMYMTESNLASFIMSALFGIIAFCIAAYGIAVGLGLWKQMKANSATT